MTNFSGSLGAYLLKSFQTHTFSIYPTLQICKRFVICEVVFYTFLTKIDIRIIENKSIVDTIACLT